MENKGLAESLQDRIMMMLMGQNPQGVDLQWIQSKLHVILADYRIEPKQEALVVYTEGKNEMYLKKFLLAKAVKGCTKRTLELYEEENRLVLRQIGKDVDTITAQDVELFFARKLAGGSSKRRCNNLWHCMSSFFGWLFVNELIPHNPMSKVEPMKFHAKKEKALTDMEIELIRQQCETSMQRAIVEMLLSTGCRASELVNIRICDLDGDHVEILGKGEKSRTVYINAKAIVAVQQYLAERQDTNPYLFPQEVPPQKRKKKGIPLKEQANWYRYPENVTPDKHFDQNSMDAALRRIGKRAGVEGVHTHRFRRTCATQALRHGMPIEYVSMMLGHEQISTTQIYLDMRESDLQSAHQKYVT